MSRPLPILLLVVLVAALALLIGAVNAPPAWAQEAETETALPAHYDTDGDGLIEIDSLAQLNAVRWDLDGDGLVDSRFDDASTENTDESADEKAAYAAAFPVVDDGSVCPAETTCAGYELTANLDFDENGDGEITEADATYWNDGGGWLPIGTLGVIPYYDGEVWPDRAPLFDVTFDGNGHTISNLYVASSHTVGLFSVLGRGAEVRNLGLPGVDIKGNNYAGGLAGYSEIETSIIAAWATGKVVGHYDVGGLIGETFGSATRCWAAVDVTGSIHVGGLVGENEYTGTITDSFATGTVNGSDRDAGGLVGYNAALDGRDSVGTIIRSYATGSVSGNGQVGGLVGHNDGKIKASYATGTVSGNRFVGSLVGFTYYAPIKASYAAGMARERYARGVHLRGLVGRTFGTISGSYYDSDVAGRTNNNGKTTAELTAPTGYTGIYAGWNLDLDNADRDDDDSTGGDDPWDFGTSQQYPALKADFNGDGTATWQEFGYQARERPTLAARVAGPRVFLRWNPVDASHWTNPPRIAYALYRNGEKVDGYDDSSTSYIDTGLTVGQTYTYQVAALLNGVEAPRSDQAAATPESAPANYDADGDGLIEIDHLAQLNAVRWDLDGDGLVDSRFDDASTEDTDESADEKADYSAAFPVAEGGSVCPAGTDCVGYELTASLDFDENGDGEITAADSAYWNDGEGWEPIGAKHKSFSGVFEGNAHTIANLFIDRFEVEVSGFIHSFTNQGLFAELWTGGEIRNLGLTQVDVKGGDYVGGLAGWSNGTISGCYVTGKVVGTYDTGGLTGENWHVISNSYADVTVSGGRHAGGLTGENEHSGKIINSYATGNVSGETETGGLVGFTEPGGIITGSYATGAVNGQWSNGGLVGHNKATISASYATGAVNGLGLSGGLVGFNEGTVSATYATGSARSQSGTGGLVGRNSGTITASYATGKAINAVGDRHLGTGGLVGANVQGTITASYHDSDTSGHSDARSRTTAQLQTPTGYVGIYSAWNVDLDGNSAGDNPWDFGTHQQYPALQVDFNGDSTATWQEFGHQSRLVATASHSEIQLFWNGVNPADPITASSVTYVLYRDGAQVTGYDGSSLSYIDAAVTLGQTYTYQVATLVNGVEVRRSNTVSIVAESRPDFGAATIDAQSYTENADVGTVTLPEATGGDDPLTYTLTPDLPDGLSFDAGARAISGTPTEPQAETEYTYTVTDGDGETASLTFTIEVGAESVAVTETAIGEGDDNLINAAEAEDGITLTGTATRGASVSVSYEGQALATTTADPETGEWSVTIPADSLPEGAVTVAVAASMEDGHSAEVEYQFSIDRTAPEVIPVELVMSPTNDNTPEVVISASEPGTVVFGGNCGDASPPAITTPDTETRLTYPQLADGKYSGCSIAVTDAAGNTGYPAVHPSFWDIVVDTQAPTLESSTVYPVGEIVLRFSEEISWFVKPDIDAFTVLVNGDKEMVEVVFLAIGWHGNGHDQREVLLELSGPVPEGVRVVVSYSHTDTWRAPLQDLAGNLFPSGDYQVSPEEQQTAPATETGRVWVNTTGIVAREGNPAQSYTVVLDVEPTESVVIAVSSDNEDVTVQPASLTFTPDNWQMGQAVTVSVSEDDDKTDDRATISHAASGGNYDGVTVASVTVSVTDDDSDREILRDFYNATGGSSWTNIGNWLSDKPLNQWHGVTVNGQGQVTHLSLRDNSLSGSLPAQLGKLEALQVLSLDRNGINGSLPTELGNLSNLTRLALNRNSLTGSIPSGLGSLPNLSIIGLARNGLSGSVPASLGNLSGLTRLSLHDNTGLSGALPSGFTGMANLQRLAIANTGLCAPDTQAFDDWLDTVPDQPGGVPTCE